MIEFNSETSLEDLLNIKEELKKIEMELGVEIEHKKKLKKPYRYSVSSYSRLTEGGNAKYITTKSKFIEHCNKTRIGTGLIYYGYTYLYNKDKSKELIDLFINSKDVSGMPGSLKTLSRVLNKGNKLNGYKYEKALVELITEFIQGERNKFNSNPEMVRDFKKLGKSLDENIKEDGSNKEEIIRNTELDNYRVVITTERIAVLKKGE